MDGGALVLTGAPGAGKSTVLEMLTERLSAEGVEHGALESEQLAWGEPWLPLEVALRQLAAVCRLQREGGRRLFLIVATTETEEELQGVVAAIGAARTLVICLHVEPATAAARVAAREPDWWSGKADLVEHAAELAAVIPGLPGVDAVVSNEGRPAMDVAAQVRDALEAHGLLGG